MKKKRFVTVIPDCPNYGLVKDVGMIPYIMAKYYGYDSLLVTLKNDGVYPYLKMMPELKIEFLNNKNEIIHYISKSAKQIDVLNIYHLSISKSLFWANTYKQKNPSGKVFLKLDIDFRGIAAISSYSTLRKTVIRHLLKRVDIVSAESTAVCEKLEKLLQRKIIYIPNGYYEFDYNKVIQENSIKKENTLLTVGRLGTKQKATELLLEAYARSGKAGIFKLRLVGTIEKGFQKYIDEYFYKYPDLKDYIEFTGPITQRSELILEYQKAKIFILTSRWEGSPLVIPEAMAYGCYLVLSPEIPSAPNIVADEKIGLICENLSIKEIANKIDMAILKANETNPYLISQWAKQNFNWGTLLEEPLHSLIDHGYISGDIGGGINSL